MFKYLIKITTLAVCLCCSGFLAQAQTVNEPKNTDPDWSKPYQPFRIAGNLYYVGTYDLACYLIVTPKGNILINTGLSNSEAMIKKNIATLGFKLADTKILLTTQAHFDHMGAMAAIKKITGAKMMVDQADAGVLLDGGKSDYALGGAGSTFRPVKPDRLLHNGDLIKLGDMQLVMLHHPGHTKGSCSFQFTVKDKQRSYQVLIANMPTIVTEKSFNEIAAYPAIAADYSYTLNSMKKLSFDLWLSSHTSQFNFHQKHQQGDPYNPAAFMDKKGYDDLLNQLQDQYSKKLKGQ